MKRSRLYLLTIFFASVFMHSSLAWDSTGHRLTASIALRFIDESTKVELLRILEQHPRYQQDFIEQMPDSIARASSENRFEWLLGQAAFWPDRTRSLPDSERNKYNRANWHYIDGAWLRGQATTQGNTYIGAAAFQDTVGPSAQNIEQEAEVDNVMTALDFNTRLLADEHASLETRAVALCWVLHLIGDIHQPLHVGSLYSANRFANGDRGGNGIETDDGNLHSRWDRALRSEGVSLSLDLLLAQHSETLRSMGGIGDTDWSLWMAESRALLLNTVYTEAMKTAIARSDNSSAALESFLLDADYVQAMKYHSGLRLALAGRRLALWLEINL